jgi:NADH:ubiquinone oxidoreductase subunit 2 (subunit N)
MGAAPLTVKFKKRMIDLNDKYTYNFGSSYAAPNTGNFIGSGLFENDLMASFPEIFLLTATLIILIYGVFYSYCSQAEIIEQFSGISTNKYENKVVLPQPAILTIHCTWLSVLAIFFTLLLVLNNPMNLGTIFYNTFVIDTYGSFFKVALLLSSGSAMILAMQYSEKINHFEYPVLLLLSILGMLCLISSNNLISMYMAIELQSLCFYVIAALKRNSSFSTEAGLKYFILGAFSSGVLLFGCSLVYGFTGAVTFSSLNQILLLQNNVELASCTVGLIFIAVSFLFKITAVPFHMWAPDVYEGSPTSVTAFFAIATKIAVISVLMRFFLEAIPTYNVLSDYALYSPAKVIGAYSFGLAANDSSSLMSTHLAYSGPLDLFMFCSICSMIVGSLGAMSQKKIKRLVAYSSIANVGYLLIGFCCYNLEGLSAVFIHLIIYVVMTCSMFTIILVPVHRDFGYLGRTKYITDLSILFRTNTMLAFTLTITLFSLAGIPPLAGFLGKYYLMSAAFNSSFSILACVAGITSVLSCVYYIRLIRIMYFSQAKALITIHHQIDDNSVQYREVSKASKFLSFAKVTQSGSYILAMATFFLIAFFFDPSSILLLTHKALLSLIY